MLAVMMQRAGRQEESSQLLSVTIVCEYWIKRDLTKVPPYLFGNYGELTLSDVGG